jgi:hypothetical protein
MPAKAGIHDTSKRDDRRQADRAVDPCLRRGDGVRMVAWAGPIATLKEEMG